MPTEQRVIASKPKIGARPTSTGAAAETADDGAAAKGAGKKGSKRLVLVLVAVLVAGGAGWWFLLGPGSGGDVAAEEVAEPAPEPGEVMRVDAVSINLAGGRYLRLGFGLQLVKDVAHTPDSAQALDLAITLFSGRTVEEISTSEGREALRAAFMEGLEEAYHGDVIDVYFTDFVTQ